MNDTNHIKENGEDPFPPYLRQALVATQVVSITKVRLRHEQIVKLAERNPKRITFRDLARPINNRLPVPPAHRGESGRRALSFPRLSKALTRWTVETLFSESLAALRIDWPD